MKENSTSGLVFKVGSKPFDVSYAEWTAIWWKWLHSIPEDSSPALDVTGKFCHIAQFNPNVWFIAGTLGGSATRKCTIPYGKAIFFPIITSIFSFVLDPQLKTEEELISAVTKDIDTVERMSLRIDEVTFEELNQFRVRSQPFDDIIKGVQTKTVSDGYWILLKPPTIGNHTIHFTAQNIDFFNEATYHFAIIADQPI